MYQRRCMEQRHEVLREGEKVLEMKCLRSLVGVSRMDRVRNEEVRSYCRAGEENDLASIADQRVFDGLGTWREWMRTV